MAQKREARTILTTISGRDLYVSEPPKTVERQLGARPPGQWVTLHRVWTDRIGGPRTSPITIHTGRIESHQPVESEPNTG